MSWIKKLFGKKETTSYELEFDEIPQWLESKSKNLNLEFEKYSKSVFSDIKASISRLKKSVSLLEEALPEGKYHLKMVKIATSNKDNMVKQMRMLIDNIEIPKKTDSKAIIKFHDNTMQSLIVCLENMMKSYQYAKLVYIEDSKQVVTDVNVLRKHLNKLIEPINEKKEILLAIENANLVFLDIKSSLFNIEVETKKIKEAQEKIITFKKEREEKQKQLLDLKESNEWKNYQNYINEIETLTNNAKKINLEINELIFPLNKIITRLLRLGENKSFELKPQIKEALELCLSNPNSLSHEFFNELKSVIDKAPLGLSSDKMEKLIEQIKVASNSFPLLKNQYQTILKEIDKKNRDISRLNIINKIEELNSDIKSLNDREDFTEKELTSSKKGFEAFKIESASKKDELKKSIAIIDKDVSIKL